MPSAAASEKTALQTIEPATPEEARRIIGLPAGKTNVKDLLLKQVALSGK